MKKCDVFTPPEIAKQMAGYLHPSGTLLEPSVGKGDLLKYINVEKYDIDVFDTEQSYLDCIQIRVNKHCTDFLKHDFGDTLYQNIIMNPPYIRFQDLHEEYRSFIQKRFKLLSSGNIDIYLAFILKCLELLDNNGVMVAITPSSWLYNKSCEQFKSYLYENKYIQEIIDFGSKKVFKGVNVYCCITVFKKNTNKKQNYEIPQNTVTKLNSLCTIKYGIATLRDKVFIHDEKLFNEPCWKEILKVSKNTIRFIIYPYNTSGKIINESQFKHDNPKTYEYLEQHKAELSKRDLGKKQYEAWYAYGRKQGITIPSCDKCVYVSTLAPKEFKLYPRKPILFYSGLVIIPNTHNDFDTIVNTINQGRDAVFEKCSKRGSGWINITPKSMLGLELHH